MYLISYLRQLYDKISPMNYMIYSLLYNSQILLIKSNVLLAQEKFNNQSFFSIDQIE
jgi:hypothetical protein